MSDLKEEKLGPLSALYKPSLSLLTDLYQLTMAYGYWVSGNLEKHASFYMSFRNNPFHGGFAVSCGLAHLVDYIQHLQFSKSDIDFLATLNGLDDKPLFRKEFLDFLHKLEFSCDVHAVPEGTVVFAKEPIVRVTGPIIQCQLLETLLLNIINFQTLVATKAARIAIAAGADPIVEFGLRRAQGADGALAASYAAYIGGCSATSNVLAGKIFGIPVKGTHAHSWVMSFANELEAFEKYAHAMPNNCIFLVDTYDTADGVKHAIKVGKQLQADGYKLAGIRLDSGDLAYLSIEARRMLDEAGFTETQILASNDLDEHVIQSLKDQAAAIDIWGVGTKLATAYDQPALNGVYKLSAIKEPGHDWEYKLKLSEQSAKISTPGFLQIRRFTGRLPAEPSYFAGDMIYNEHQAPDGGTNVIIDPLDFTRRKAFSSNTPYQDLLVPIFKEGKLIYELPKLAGIKAVVKEQLDHLHPTIKRILNPHEYPVGLEQGLHKLKTDLILETRKIEAADREQSTKHGQW